MKKWIKRGFTLGIVALMGSIPYFYITANQQITYYEGTPPNQQKIRYLIMAGTKSRIQERYDAVIAQLPPDQLATLQFNLRYCPETQSSPQDLPPQLQHLSKPPKNLQVECFPVRNDFGTAWEIQSAIVTATRNSETIITPLIPEQALKISFASGQKQRVQIIPLEAATSRRLTEFGKSYLGWVAPEIVSGYRSEYYAIDLWL